jgi:hypothetical protein
METNFESCPGSKLAPSERDRYKMIRTFFPFHFEAWYNRASAVRSLSESKVKDGMRWCPKSSRYSWLTAF